MFVRLLAAVALATAAAAPLMAAEDGAAATEVKPYPLTVCLASGAALPEAPVVVVHDGQEYKFGTEEAAAPFRADPSTLAPRLAELVAQQQAAAGGN